MAESKAAKREFNPISLSFLDVMSCGFGAVVLIFLILDHSSSTQNAVTNPELAAEINLLNDEITDGEANLVRVRNTISDVDFQMVEAQGLARSIQDEITTFLEELAQLENTTLARRESVEKLKSDIQALEQELERLRASSDSFSGNFIRPYVGDGNRQYLTGLILGGSRILILVDTSASMLDNTIVNIIRRRNMSDDAKLNSEKWVAVRKVVDWLTTQLPPPSQYQILAFNEDVQPLIPGTEGNWLEVADEAQLSETVSRLNQLIPVNGTNLENVFQAVAMMNPLPDNIYLITDGLPTLGTREGGLFNRSAESNKNTISGREREELFNVALERLPAGIPVNVVLAPLEGDPMAASLYWKLAVSTGGSFLSPSRDWP
ncbi:MAG: VWA domain-containing protein [Gammaproteobacteria bacterium]|jgi:polyhydroxyalkanoate synthesis regulator phasin|nr:VWA domain-containing protein [Gammaproteobacteria bacterium]MBT6043572.1 VWA domain-containing protein [Gammaproteobacteria bacterium]